MSIARFFPSQLWPHVLEMREKLKFWSFYFQIRLTCERTCDKAWLNYVLWRTRETSEQRKTKPEQIE